MLIDDLHLLIKAGHGGPGKVSFDGHGPDGGNGGKGGDVIIRATSDLKALNQFSGIEVLSARDGDPGRNRRSFGKNGADVTYILPIGTTLSDLDTGQFWELTSLDQEIILCRGGLGGRGNLEFKSGKNRSPSHAQPGLPGESRRCHLVLRFIADYGLIGLPNAGKSSLLNVLTNAKAAVGAYPFTTLEANLGVYRQKIIADIPGLIAGASAGRGLGTNFLKHIEKVKLLLHCLSADSPDLVSDFNTINNELMVYNPDLLIRPRILLLTKSDLISDHRQLNRQLKLLASIGFPALPISVYHPDQIETLQHSLLSPAN